jgi:hypothetical protein
MRQRARSSVQNPATIPCDQRLFQGLSTASPVRAPSGRNRFHCRRTKNGWATPNRFGPLLMAGMAGRRPGRNGCFGTAAAGVLHGARTIPTVAGRLMRALSRLADVAGFWTLDRTTITGRSAVILRQHTTPFRPMIVPFDDLDLVYQSLRTLEPPHTHKVPRVNAQDSKLGPIQPWDVKDFLRPGRVSADLIKDESRKRQLSLRSLLRPHISQVRALTSCGCASVSLNRKRCLVITLPRWMSGLLP